MTAQLAAVTTVPPAVMAATAGSGIGPMDLLLGYGPLGLFVILLVTGKFVALTREVEREQQATAEVAAERDRLQVENASLRQAMDEKIVPALYEQVVPALRESTQALQRYDRVMVRLLDKGIIHHDDVPTRRGPDPDPMGG